MRNVLWLAVAALLVSGCGVTDAEDVTPAGPVVVATTDDALSLSADSWVAVRRDLRRCMAPLCGGYWVKDVNRKQGREVYVRALDFRKAGLGEADVAKALRAADGELVLYGRPGEREWHWGTLSFIVQSAWRGLPGVVPVDGEAYLRTEPLNVQCIRAPCPTALVHRLNGDAELEVHDVRVERALKGWVDAKWVARLLEGHGAVATGQLGWGADTPWGSELVLDVSQVFVRLPYLDFPCPLMPAIRDCPTGMTFIWQRTADRCLMPAGCVVPGPCLTYQPVCAAGYTLDSWPATVNACPAFACDPTFTLE